MAEVVTPETIRASLVMLGNELRDCREELRSVNREIGAALATAVDTPGFTLTEAMGLVGVSKPTAYRLLRAAE